MSPQAQANSRQISLDSLRGALLVMMGLNHIPTDLQRLSNHPFGFVSAAAGFVFLSGFLVGKVYGRRSDELGLRGASRLLGKRIGQIYRVHALAALSIFIWVQAYLSLRGETPPGAPSIFGEAPVSSLLATLALLHRPGLLDVLPLYCLLMALVPFALWMLQRGEAALLLGLSALTWVLTNIFDDHDPLRVGVIDTGAFNLGAWQFLFLAALLLGHRSYRGGSLPVPSAWLLTLLLGIATWLFAWRHGFLDMGLTHDEKEWWTNKNNLMVVRAANIALVLYLIGLAVKRWPRAFAWRSMAFLGRHSLEVYGAHVIAVTLILGLPEFFEQTLLGRLVAPVFLVAAMAAAALIATRLKARSRVISRYPPASLDPGAAEAGLARPSQPPVGSALASPAALRETGDELGT